MTDKEIIQALECCSKSDAMLCYGCPFTKNCSRGFISRNALDLINRLKGEAIHYRRKAQNQKQELKRLNKVIEVYGEENDKLKTAFVQVVMDREYAKSEAVKEFADLVDRDIEEKLSDIIKEQNPHLYLIHQIVKDRLKEMVGEDMTQMFMNVKELKPLPELPKEMVGEDK